MWDMNLCLYLISSIYIYIYVFDIWVCLQMGISMKPSDFNHQEWRFDQWMRMALSTGNQPVFWDPQDGIDMLPMVNQIEAGQEQERPRNFRCLMMSHAHFLKVRPWSGHGGCSIDLFFREATINDMFAKNHIYCTCIHTSYRAYIQYL